MNKKEKELLELLTQNARYSVEDLAKMLDKKTTEVAKMIDSLESRGIILQYTTVLNDKKLMDSQKMVKAVIEVRVRPEKKSGFKAIADRISKYSNVVEHYLISGNYDFLVIVEGKNMFEVSSFVSNKLATIDHVLSTRTHFIMMKYKEKGILVDSESLQDRLAVSA